jgi:hypothetical protein
LGPSHKDLQERASANPSWQNAATRNAGGAAQLGIVTGLERLALALVPYTYRFVAKLAAKASERRREAFDEAHPARASLRVTERLGVIDVDPAFRQDDPGGPFGKPEKKRCNWDSLELAKLRPQSSPACVRLAPHRIPFTCPHAMLPWRGSFPNGSGGFRLLRPTRKFSIIRTQS